jgi:hypothetical protein
MLKPHVDHNNANFELGKHVSIQILHNWLIQPWTF